MRKKWLNLVRYSFISIILCTKNAENVKKKILFVLSFCAFGQVRCIELKIDRSLSISKFDQMTNCVFDQAAKFVCFEFRSRKTYCLSRVTWKRNFVVQLFLKVLIFITDTVVCESNGSDCVHVNDQPVGNVSISQCALVFFGYISFDYWFHFSLFSFVVYINRCIFWCQRCWLLGSVRHRNFSSKCIQYAISFGTNNQKNRINGRISSPTSR